MDRKQIGQALLMLVWLTALFVACTSNPPANACQQTQDCSEGLECIDSKCQIPPANKPCPDTTPTRCDGLCINTRTDAQHCGYCNKRCNASERCEDGRCISASEAVVPDGGTGCLAPTPTRCGDTCVDTRSDNGHCGFCGNTCQAGTSCQDGSCQRGQTTCPQQQLLCQGTCIDPNNNPAHCGACGTSCGNDELCSAGTCVKVGTSSCSDRSLTRCGATCVNINADDQHCGACHKACTTPQVCAGGACACPAGFAVCASACTDLLIDPNHCGACNNKCAANAFCASGRCLSSCPKSTPDICNKACVDLQSQFQHCGTCGNTCTQGQRCIKGTCQCVGGLVSCGSKCVDVRSDSRHCGACGKTCTQGQLCSQGTCITTCPQGTPNICFGGCVDTRTDNQHCGGCGNTCTGGAICLQGTCRCPGGSQLCDGRCIDTKHSSLHCGKCGNPCQAGSICSAGSCRTSCPLPTPLSCYGGCVDPDINIQHCGTCGNTCPLGGTCDKGTCTCPGGRTSCAGLCVDTDQDRLNCGTCGNVCPADEVCMLGTCSKCTSSLTKCGGTCCPEAQNCCGNTCHNLQTDRENCGACGNKCNQGESCCGGQCVDLKVDTNNCGACHLTCANDHRCDAALCIWQGKIPTTNAPSTPAFTHTITATAISFNSLYYAIALSDFSIVLWNVETNKQVAILKGHTKTIRALAFSYDQAWLASGSDDNTAKIWQVQTQTLATTFTSHKGPVNDLAWSPDNQRLVSASTDKTAQIWERSTRKVHHTLTHGGGVLEVDWSRNGRYIVTSADDKKVSMWDATNAKQLIANFNPFVYFGKEPRRNIRISPDSSWLFATERGDTGIWIIPNGDFVRFGLNNGDKIHDADWSPNSKEVLYSVSKGTNASLQLDDLVQFQLGIKIKTIPLVKTAPFMDWSADGRVILYTEEKRVKLIMGPRSCVPSKLLRTLNLSTQALRDVAWSPDNKRAAIAAQGKILIVDTETGKTEKTYIPDQSIVNAVDWSPDGAYVLSGGKKAQLWNLTTGNVNAQIHGALKGSTISDILFTPNGLFAVSITPSLTVALYNVLSSGSLRPARVWGRHDISPNHLALHINNRLAAVPHGKKIRLWDVLQASYLGDITLAASSRGRVAFSPDGKFIASALSDGSLRFWSTASKREVRALTGYAAPLNHADFHPERPLIATSDNNKEILLINTDTGKTAATLKGHKNNIRYLLFNRIGNRLASISDKGNLRIWGCP